VIGADGVVVRLPAMDPPIGMAATLQTAERPWDAAHDLLLLFTDGIPDAADATGARLGEDVVLERVRARRTAAPRDIVGDVFAIVESHVGQTPLQDDLTLVVLRT
jgi:serine phosphatase RsbU (regulator of sigma subunit)